MDEVLAGRAGRLVKENADIWEAYQKLGKACYEAGPLEGKTLRLVKLTLAAGTDLLVAGSRLRLCDSPHGENSGIGSPPSPHRVWTDGTLCGARDASPDTRIIGQTPYPPRLFPPIDFAAPPLASGSFFGDMILGKPTGVVAANN